MTDTKQLKTDFWKSLDDSPFIFLQLDADPDTAVPMTAQLDKDANSAIWFFTTKDHTFAKGGPATATFAGKGHDMFARFSGVLSEETSQERFEKQWSTVVEAWFPGGKDDPNLLMLRMDLGQAEIWNGDLGFVDNAKMLFGFDVREDAKEEHTETTL
ncbi:pyridoxamine 5'-phosphate oxidase family protein [Aurantiacibacter sediminis]|uniref:Pyridoxamine 5'-phosphate oxidase family protein n=1 Tax=Aurantiacibacter sediminis TaxID=2793064 RepID=A0ABS0N3F3_9SPHN|nr:pyridoxamine 5'-phosphate oxidase family protein [Aurantiacibacter sediminis]MBH5322494.1 pyridoxamine 5'-phosphate oxidase family protein [Aurantiacibacter sediminis]